MRCCAFAGKPDQARPTVTSVVSDGAGPLPVVKLSPSIRTQDIEASVDSIPGDAIRQFLTKPRVVTKEEAEAAPYILGSDDQHLILGQGNSVYVRGELDKERVRYTVVRKGEKLVDHSPAGLERLYRRLSMDFLYPDPDALVITGRQDGGPPQLFHYPLTRAAEFLITSGSHEALVGQVPFGTAQVTDAAPYAVIVRQHQAIRRRERAGAAVFQARGRKLSAPQPVIVDRDVVLVPNPVGREVVDCPHAFIGGRETRKGEDRGCNN